jgi:hypothetical protein
MRLVSTLAGVFLGAVACGDGMPARTDGGPPAPDPASVQNIAAYEGQEAFITVLESPGDDWSSANVTASTGGLEIVSQRCNASLCAVLARVPDATRNTGQSIPAPIDAMRHYLRVTAPSGESQGLVQVFPTDALSASGATSTTGTYFAASVTGGIGSLVSGMGAEPVRWVVFGSATLETFDVSAEGDVAGAGGHRGGAAGAAGEGPAGGARAMGSVGAGGGGSFEEGGLGAMATDPAPATGADCAVDFFAAQCGGSGGGGASGVGGAGAGSVSIMVLGSACIGTVRGRGGDGAGGGGGGGGALALVAASVLDCDPVADVDGGAGDGDGGDGGAGHLLVAGVNFPRITFAASDLITSETSLDVRGVAAPEHGLRIERVTDSGAVEVAAGTTGADGAFSIATPLVAGLNRLRITQLDADGTHPMRAFNGNHVELERRDGFVRQLPVGGLLDVASIP